METVVEFSDPIDRYLYQQYHFKGERMNNGLRYFTFGGNTKEKHVIFYPISGQDTKHMLMHARIELGRQIKLLSTKSEWINPF